MKKLTTSEFIDKANATHKGIYAYDKTIYTKSNVPVVITCSKHGDFTQQPNNHLFGNGCPICRYDVIAIKKSKNTNQFIESSRKVHGDLYDYSESNYIRWNIDIEIICNLHGKFKQQPNNHLNGSGCPICANNSRQEKYENRKLTLADFIRRAKEKHHSKYGYEKTVYKNSQTPVIISCPIHGEFQQNPFRHLLGRGCRKCGFIITESRRVVSTEEFIEKAKKVHGELYDYSKFEYIQNTIKSVIICSNHGEFKQSGASHLSGAGCPQCKASRGEKQINKILKILNIEFLRQFKIQDCKNKYPLPFDFAIIDKDKVLALIEYQGKQHYESIDYWGGKDKLLYVQNNDRIKMEYCVSHNIPLLVISHNDSIENSLLNFIRNL